VSFCGVLKTHARLPSIGETIDALAAIEIIGVDDSDATSIIASEPGAAVDPMIASTLSSLVSLRAFFTACVESVASSSTM
jgi:hypothetical protein